MIAKDKDGSPAGFYIGWFWHGKGQLEHPDYQGLGLGKALELAGFDALKSLGASGAFINHVSLNDKAIALSPKMALGNVIML